MAEINRTEPHNDLEGEENLPHKPADDREEIYYEGSPMLRGEMGKLILWSVLGLAMMGAPWLINRLGWGPVVWWGWAIFIVIGLGLVLVPHLLIRARRYRITNYRIDIERGLLGKTIDTLELWHVEDIRFRQSLGDRIFNVGDITVISHDDTTPELLLAGVPNPRPLFETLKQRVIAVKRQRGVIKMDMAG